MNQRTAYLESMAEILQSNSGRIVMNRILRMLAFATPTSGDDYSAALHNASLQLVNELYEADPKAAQSIVGEFYGVPKIH